LDIDSLDIDAEDLLHAEDEGFHPVPGEPFQTEGSWWCFFAPERRLSGWIYHLTRLNLGVASGGVWIWDDTATQWYEVPYFALQHLQPVDPGADLRDMRWADGTQLRSLEPFQRYEIKYRDGDELSLELEYQAIMAPYVSTGGDPTRPFRYEQPSRATGRLVLRGETIDIDCTAIFDHSWGVRPERTTSASASASRPTALANQPAPYLWGTASAEHAFFVMGSGGRLVRDGKRAELIDVTQEIERSPDDGTIQRIRVTGVDRDGRSLDAVGTRESLIIRPSAGASVGFIYTMRWRLDGSDASGDVQDVWPAARWAAARRRPRPR
jgi:hypothetical protein